MATCRSCSRAGDDIAAVVGLCRECIKSDFPRYQALLQEVHRSCREALGLPGTPPADAEGPECPLCVHRCRPAEGERTYCGLRMSREGRLVGATARYANTSWYHDPLPTNCVADWVCPGGTGAGYPRFAHRKGPEHGFHNLAVFYQACTFDCLFCQNWHYRRHSLDQPRVTVHDLASAADELTACICFFGGDPTPQLPHALRVSRLARQQSGGRILRICWETNGSMHPKLLRQMADLSLESGGCIKFDLKAWDEGIHFALCGVSNERTLHNFAWLADYTGRRPEPPPLVASTLLVPGYVDEDEVYNVARFVASLNPEIPYSLLAFAPHYFMHDLPTTSRRQAYGARDAAVAAGLRRVRIANMHLLRSQG